MTADTDSINIGPFPVKCSCIFFSNKLHYSVACGENADCLEVNSTIFKCVCKDDYEGPDCHSRCQYSLKLKWR